MTGLFYLIVSLVHSYTFSCFHLLGLLLLSVSKIQYGGNAWCTNLVNAWKQYEECLPVGVKVKDGTVWRKKREIKLEKKLELNYGTLTSEISFCEFLFSLSQHRLVYVQVKKYIYYNCTPVMYYTFTKSVLACIHTQLAALWSLIPSVIPGPQLG